MLANMAISLIMHKRITTTVAKAKALRVYVEPLLTRSKDDTTASRRLVFSHLQNKYAVTELFTNISQKIGDRPGGYTRIIKTGHRLGDTADICFIELVDFDDNMAKTAKTAKKTRRSRNKKSDNSAVVAETTAAETADVEAAATETTTAEAATESAAATEETTKAE